MFENDYQLEIMTSSALKGKAPATWKPADWARYHRTFKRVVLSPREMAIEVWRGYAFTTVFTEARREEFFKWAYHIALDFDTGDETSSLPFLMERVGTFAWMFASFGYSTPSSTDESPRSRVVFILDAPIHTADEYRAAYAAIAWRMAEEGSKTDPACKDPLRLYYGSPGCAVSTNWSVLPIPALNVLIDQYREAHPPAPPPKVISSHVVVEPDEKRVNAMLAQLGRRVAAAPKGERHTTLLRTARLAGGYIAGGALDEVAVIAELSAAARGRYDDDEEEIERVIRDGIANGKGEPLRFTAPQSLMGVFR